MTLKRFQKILRASQTDAEQRLWYYLRAKRFAGFKFRRQHSLQGYIVDFVCLEQRLIIELDGGQHSDQVSYDEKRTEKLKKDGFRVLRFWNTDMFKQTETVLAAIYQALIQNPPSPAVCFANVDLSHKGRGEDPV